MNKAKTAKVLSAAAMANMAAFGFAVTPAIASAHPAAGTTDGPATATVPSAGRPHPGATYNPPYWVGVVKKGKAATEARAAAGAARPRGFVPRGASGVKPDTETGCDTGSGRVCFGLYGGGSHVSYTNQHFWGVNTCHIGWMSIFSPGGAFVANFTAYNSPEHQNFHYFCSKQEFSVPRSQISNNYFSGVNFCGLFQNVPGTKCEPVR